jgi:hypothetical protein
VLVARITKEFQVSLTLKEFLSDPSVSGVIGHIGD